jgi:hypothetical protein
MYSNQAPAQAVFEPDLIVDECHPAGDVFASVDAFCQHAEVCDELERLHVNHLRHNFKRPVIFQRCKRFKRRKQGTLQKECFYFAIYPCSPLAVGVAHLLHFDHLRYNSKRRKRRKRWRATSLSLSSSTVAIAAWSISLSISGFHRR